MLDWGHRNALNQSSRCHARTKTLGFCKNSCTQMHLRDVSGYEWTRHFRGRYCSSHMRQLIPILGVLYQQIPCVPEICFIIGTYL